MEYKVKERGRDEDYQGRGVNRLNFTQIGQTNSCRFLYTLHEN